MTFCFLFFGYLGVPVPFSLMAGVFVGALLDRRVARRDHPEDLRRRGFRSAAGDSVLPAGRRTHELGQRRGADRQSVAVAGRAHQGRAVAGRRRVQHVLLGNVGIDHRRRRGDEPRARRPDEAGGLQPAFIAAIIAAASTIAALVPPSITAVVYGAVGNVSIAGLFMAGVVPGLDDRLRPDDLLLLLRSDRHAAGRARRCARSLFAAGDAALPLMIPVILLGGILTGWFTPTEAGVVAVIWIIAVVIPALNRGHLKNIPYDFCLAGLIFSLPLITIGAANAFGWMLAYLRGAIVIADWITAIAGNDPHLIMLLLVLLFTVVGDFIEPVPTIIIFMPLVNALTQAGDINAVHMGVVLIATLAFGLITPPYGLVLLMASKFVGVRSRKALRAALPIYVVFLVTITFTIYFPKVVLWLPKQVIPESVGCFKSPSGSGYICPK